MARPRKFDEHAVLQAATDCFWRHGFVATSMRDLIDKTGLTSASLYNAFGDKRALYQRVLAHYVRECTQAHIRDCGTLPPRQAIVTYLHEALTRAVQDKDYKGCLLMNAALDAAPQDQDIREAVQAHLQELEDFFHRNITRGQADGSIPSTYAPRDLARHFLGVLMGLRMLGRVRPDPLVLEAVLAPALACLDSRTTD